MTTKDLIHTAKALFAQKKYAYALVAACAIIAVGGTTLALQDNPKKPAPYPAPRPAATAPANTQSASTTTPAPVATPKPATLPASKPATENKTPPKPATTISTPVIRPTTAQPSPLQSITITGPKAHDTRGLHFRTVGKHYGGYLIRWQSIGEPDPTLPNGTSTTAVAHDIDAMHQEGSATMMHGKFSEGEYKVTICQSIGGSCGIESNPIYLTLTPMEQCTISGDTFPIETCLRIASTYKFHF